MFIFDYIFAVLNIVVPLAPAAPAAPVAPVAPVSPFGIVKLKTAADVGPLFETVADVPAAPVIVVPTDIVADVPFVPFSLLFLLHPECPEHHSNQLPLVSPEPPANLLFQLSLVLHYLLLV